MGYVIGIAVLFILLLVFKTIKFKPSKINKEPLEKIDIDVESAALHLGEAVRIKTISLSDYNKTNWGEFERFIKYLEETYPITNRSLQRERINDYSLLYKWKGKNNDLMPALLTAHMDVVPVEEGTLKDWKKPPFSGEIENGYVWGRGTLDIKIQVIAILEAVEKLLSQGFIPERDIYIGFGHDEEVGGKRGGFEIAKLLESRGIKFEFVLDEGGCVTEGMLKNVSSPIAVIGIAEKGCANIKITAESRGGHSSMPPRNTAVGEISKAICALEKNQCKANISTPLRYMLNCLGPHMDIKSRFIIANLWLFGPIFKKVFSKIPSGNALLRTTTAATMFEGSMEPNVLPQKARAVINFRIAPYESGRDVIEHVKNTIKNERIKIEALRLDEPSKVSSVDSYGYRYIEKQVLRVFPKAVVTPYIVLAATDARKYENVCDNIYRFSPYKIRNDELNTMHGTNECISFENIKKAITFYIEMLKV